MRITIDITEDQRRSEVTAHIHAKTHGSPAEIRHAQEIVKAIIEAPGAKETHGYIKVIDPILNQ